MPQRYVNGDQSKIAPEYLRIHAIFDGFIANLATLSENYIASNNLDYAQRMLDETYKWAQVNSAAKPSSPQGKYTQAFELSAIPLLLDSVLQEGKLTAADNVNAADNQIKLARIGQWLNDMSYFNMSTPTDPQGDLRQNNIGSWQGLLYLGTATVTGDDGLITTGLRQYDILFDKIRTDGASSEELLRNELALWYHEFALIPQLLSAEYIVNNPAMMQQYQQNPWMRKNDDGMMLQDMVGLVLDSLDTPALMTRLTKNKDIRETTSNPAVMGPSGTYISSFLEIYNKHFPTPRVEDLLINPARSPYHYGDYNMIFTGDVDLQRQPSTLRASPPNGDNHNIYGLTISDAKNTNFTFVDNSDFTGADIEKAGKQTSAAESFAQRGLDYLLVEKTLAPAFFAAGATSIRQFVALGYNDSAAMTVSDGQQVNSWNTFLGYAKGSSGDLTLTGADAQWYSRGDMKVGAYPARACCASITRRYCMIPTAIWASARWRPGRPFSATARNGSTIAP